MLNVLYLCPLGRQQRQWRIESAPSGIELVMRRSTDLTRDELLRLAAAADVIITERSGAIDRGLIEAAPRLRLIQRVGSLAHDIDLDAARERSVAVAYRPIRGTIAVAENLMLQMLAVLRRAGPLQRVIRTPPERFRPPQRTTEDVFAFNWSGETRVALLRGKTVGILGFGEIGAELARYLLGWRVTVLYNKRQRLPEAIERDLAVSYRADDAVLRESDIVVCLLPYFKETDQWLNAERIATMKRGAYLVGAGSGSVVDERAVADALRGGHLAGASFDTFEWEPILQDNPLLQWADADAGANVFLLPHIGSCNDGGMGEAREFYDNVNRLLLGEPLVNRLV